MKPEEKQLGEIFLRDPETDARLKFVSPLVENADGTTSFVVGRRDQESRWRITFKIEEISVEDSTGAEAFKEYNEALEWAANWLMSQSKGHDTHTQSFANNIAASFLAHKKPWKK